MTCETVETDTPAVRATSAIVTMGEPHYVQQILAQTLAQTLSCMEDSANGTWP
jgi:hypothetical protein